jgi:Double-stranded DNA deaminase toxin A
VSRVKALRLSGRGLPRARGIFNRVARKFDKAKRLPRGGARMISPRGASPGHRLLRTPSRVDAGAARFRPELAAHVPPHGQIGRKTTGVMDLGGNRVIYQVSGRWGGQPRPVDGAGGVLMTHVEMHTLSRMREAGLREATLYLNRAPCSFTSGRGSDGCSVFLQSLLRPGERITVYFPDAAGRTIGRLFTGG